MLRLGRIISRAGDASRACAGAWREDRTRGVARWVSEELYWRFHPRVRRWRAELPRQQAIDEEFDRRFGVDTAGEVSLSDVGVAEDDLRRGHGVYRPVWTQAFHDAIRELPIQIERFTFVDYGSGKGKALLLASEYPFKSVIGLEFARPLHQVAVENLRRYDSPTKRCGAMRSECADALVFEPPDAPLVCFFFNPFDDRTMDAVVQRLVGSVRRSPRDVFLLYCNMRDVGEHRRAFGARRGLRLIAERSRHLTYAVSSS